MANNPQLIQIYEDFTITDASGNSATFLASDISYSLEAFINKMKDADISVNYFTDETLTRQRGDELYTPLNSVYVDESGNVGIGTATTEAKLEISNSVATSLLLTKTDGFYSNQNQSIEFRTNYATTGFIHQKGEDLRFGAMGNNSNISFYTKGDKTSGYLNNGNINGSTVITTSLIKSTYDPSYDNCQMKILSNGNVGIGTTNPSAKLDVSGNVILHGNVRLNIMPGYEEIGTLLIARQDSGIRKHSMTFYNSAVKSNNYMAFNVHAGAGGPDGNNSIIEGMRIRGDGNVGIGTTSPQTKLHVEGDTRLSDGTLELRYPTSTNESITTSPMTLGSVPTLILTDTSSNALNSNDICNQIRFNVNRDYGGVTENGIGAVIGTYKGHLNYFSSGLFFSTTNDSNETHVRAVINKNGYVGIGTNSPQTALEISSSSGLRLTNTEAKINTNDRIGYIDFNNTGYGAAIESCVNVGGANNNSDLRFMTTLDYSNSYIERMRIDRRGNVGIGTTSPSNCLDIYNNNYIGVKSLLQLVKDYNGTDTGSSPSATFTDIIANIQSSNNPANNVGNQAKIIGLNVDTSSPTSIPINYTALFNGGNVGIGTNAPKAGLQVFNDRGAIISSATATGERTAILRLGTPYTQDHDAYCAKITSTNNQSSNYNSDLRFYTSIGDYPFATERMRITSAGNVGIGVTSPTSTLHVDGDLTIARSTGGGTTVYTPPIITRLNYRQTGNGNYGPVVGIATQDTAGNSKTPHLCTMEIQSNTVHAPGASRATYSGTWGTLKITPNYQSDSNTDGYASIVFPSHKRGNWGYGAIYLTDSADAGRHSINITCRQDYGYHSNIKLDGYVTGISFTSTSDIRFKENIIDLSNALQKICSIRTVNYNFKENPDVKQAGIIAQEVDTIIPEAISKIDNEKWATNYNILLTYSMEAIKELNNELKIEKAKTTELETKMADLLERITKLETV